LVSIAEALVADLAGLDVMRASRGAGDRRRPGERAQVARSGEAGGVVADLGQDAGSEDRTEAGCRAQDHCLRVGVELAGQLRFEVVDGSLHRDDDPEEPGHGVAECLFDPWWLPQRRCVQVGEDLLGQGGVVAAPGPLQQRDQASAGQLLPGRRGRRGREHRHRGTVFEVRKSVQRLRIELQKHRPQTADRLVQRPDRFLMLAGQRLDRTGVLGDRGRCRCRSVRRMCASTAASPGSDLPPACACRSR
jgi:hypothetical protein